MPFDRDHVVANIQDLRFVSGVIETPLRGVTRRHHHCAHMLGAERIGTAIASVNAESMPPEESEHDAQESDACRRSRARRARARCKRSPLPTTGGSMCAGRGTTLPSTQIHIDSEQTFDERRDTLHDLAVRIHARTSRRRTPAHPDRRASSRRPPGKPSVFHARSHPPLRDALDNAGQYGEPLMTTMSCAADRFGSARGIRFPDVFADQQPDANALEARRCSVSRPCLK